jgi:TPR repeat protein
MSKRTRTGDVETGGPKRQRLEFQGHGYIMNASGDIVAKFDDNKRIMINDVLWTVTSVSEHSLSLSHVVSTNNFDTQSAELVKNHWNHVIHVKRDIGMLQADIKLKCHDENDDDKVELHQMISMVQKHHETLQSKQNNHRINIKYQETITSNNMVLVSGQITSGLVWHPTFTSTVNSSVSYHVQTKQRQMTCPLSDQPPQCIVESDGKVSHLDDIEHVNFTQRIQTVLTTPIHQTIVVSSTDAFIYSHFQEQKNIHGQGVCIFHGIGTDINHEEARRLFYINATHSKCPKSQFAIAYCLFYGYGGDVDKTEAMAWVQLSAQQEFLPAQFFLATYDPNHKKWLQRACQSRHKQALKLSLAEQGDANAQCSLGLMYDEGTGVAQDKKEAVKWYRKSAEQVNADAQCNLGFMYNRGFGVDQDQKEAVKWFRKSAEQGNADAQCNLGFMYRRGFGVDQDQKEAVKWFRKSAEQGDASAQCILGLMYDEQGNDNAQYKLGFMSADDMNVGATQDK